MIRGTRLEQVATIVFEGRRGTSDDVEVRPETTGERGVVAVVPDEARSGKLTVRDSYGNSATTKSRVRVVAAPEPEPIDIAPSSRFFFDSQRKPSFTFEVADPALVQVELSDLATGGARQELGRRGGAGHL